VIDQPNYVELGLGCAEVCKDLDKKMNGKEVDQLNRSALKAVEELTTSVEPVTRMLDYHSLTNLSTTGP
jgi:hypothetical protein